MNPWMELEQTSELSTSARKDPRLAGPGPTGPISNNLLRADDVEYIQCFPTIKNGARMSNSPFTSPSASPLRQQPHHRNGTFSLVATDVDSSSNENLPELEITSPKHLSAKNHDHLSRNLSKASEYISTSTSPPPMPTSRARVEVHPSSNPVKRATSKSFSTVRSRPRSNQPSISNKAQHHSSLDTCTDSNPKSLHRLPSSPTSSAKASASQVDHDDLFTLEYDLDRDPTQETYEFHDQFHEQSPFSAVLSARFIHAHLSERLSDSTTFNGELANNEGDLVIEFIEPAALSSVGPRSSISPSYALDSATALGNSDPTPTPGHDDLEFEETVHIMDPFAALTMDDVINHHQPWGLDVETMINPSILGGTLAFLEPPSPSPAPTPFRDFHSRKRTRTPSPPLTQSTLTIQIPSHTSTSTSGLDSTQTSGNAEDNLAGGKAKFYKKGTLQTPPHLSNSQRRRSVSAKMTESIHIGRQPSPGQTTSVDSPLTELSASDFLASGVMSTSSIATPGEAANTADEDATVIDSGNGTPPHVNSVKTVTARKKKSSTDKGPYRIVAVNEITHCHQCRRATPHPKMHCRACPKNYCISCIVKRYHNIEFHQFREDFDCPACLDFCNCTSCCDKRREVYVSTRHIKFDKKTMAKLLSGEIRSLPHVSGFLVGLREKLKPGQDPLSSRRREPPPIAEKEKIPARRKKVSYRQDASDDDYDESDASTTPKTSVRVKPTQATLQTQRMLEESGSGRYWGAVYSLSGERIGMSYVGNNLQNVTVQTNGFSSSVANHPLSPSRQRRKRVYVGRWQDAWGFRPETTDDSLLEDEKHTNKRSRNKDLGRARFYYVGNQNVIKAWKRSRSRTVQRPPMAFLQPADDVETHISPSDLVSFDRACDRHEAADATPNDDILIDGGEDEDGSWNFWIMEDRSSPKRSNLPFLAATDIIRPSPGNVLDVCPTSILESCGQLVTEEDLVKAVTSSLQAAGTTVLLPQPPSPLA